MRRIELPVKWSCFSLDPTASIDGKTTAMRARSVTEWASRQV